MACRVWKPSVTILGIAVVFALAASVGEASIPSQMNSGSAKGKSSKATKAKSKAKGKKFAKGHGKRGKRSHAKSAGKPAPHRSAEFIDSRAQKLYTQLMARPPRFSSIGEAQEIPVLNSGKPAWLAAVYSKHLVEASPQTELLSDKLIMARVLERALEGEARRYYPKTVGLKEFLDRHKLVDAAGNIKADGDTIEKALYEEFPAGFAVRPAVGVAPSETRRGIFPEGDQFIVELLKGKTAVYQPSHFLQPVKSSVLDQTASGEAIVLQDDLILRADANKKLQAKTYREIRIHTFEQDVVEDAVPVRWVQSSEMNEADIRAAEGFVRELLRRLPPRLVSRQAWGVDVALFDNGQMIVSDIVTNRGQKIQWSSYLEQPRVLGAYVRHFEKVAGVRFEGLRGSLIRNNLGNYFSYWDSRIEKSKPGWNKVLSYLPPVP